MRRVLARACLVATTMATAAGVAAVRAADKLTRLELLAEDDKGNPVSGLTREDFEVWVEGQRQSIASFSAPSDSRPLTLIVLVDISVSQMQAPGDNVMPAPVMSSTLRARELISSTKIGEALGKFDLQGFRSQDRVRVGSIGRQTVITDRFASDPSEIKKDWQALFDVPPIEWLGPSPIWDAVERAASLLRSESGHRAIILITDGQASGNALSHSEASVRAALAGISINIVALESMLPTVPLTSMASHGVDPTQTLRDMAIFTGGRYSLVRAEFEPFDTGFNRYPAPHFKRAMDSLHQAYELTFESRTADDKLHGVEVRIKKPGVVVKARKVFVAAR